MFDQVLAREELVDKTVIAEDWVFVISSNLGMLVMMMTMRKQLGELAGREVHIPTVHVSQLRCPVKEEVLIDCPTPMEEMPEPGATFQQQKLDRGHVMKVTTPLSHPLDDVEGFKNPHHQIQFMGTTTVNHFEEHWKVDSCAG